MDFAAILCAGSIPLLVVLAGHVKMIDQIPVVYELTLAIVMIAMSIRAICFGGRYANKPVGVIGYVKYFTSISRHLNHFCFYLIAGALLIRGGIRGVRLERCE